MSIIRILAPILIGALIGYITNYIAIKMLFRPLEPKYLFGIRIPFTPGIVPRNKARLADALGKAVFAKFFNWDDLELVFLSDVFAEEVAERLALSLRGGHTLSALSASLPLSEAEREDAGRRVVSKLCIRIVESGAVRRLAIASSSYMKSQGSADGSALLGSLAAAYAGPIAEQVEAYLSGAGQEEVYQMCREEWEAFSSETVGKRLEGLFPEDDALLRAFLKEAYFRFMRENVRPIVESIDIVTQITGKMNEMSAGEVESLVLDIVARELRLVVWFGALLGALIGAVNIFI